MTDEEGQTKVEDSNAAEAEEGLISLESLDQALANVDPEFKQQLDQMSAEGSADLGGSIEVLDLSGLPEQGKWTPKNISKIIVLSSRKVFVSVKAAAIEFFKSDLPEFIGKISEILRKFAYMPKKFRMMVFSFAGVCIAVIGALTFLWKKGIPEEPPLFMQSISEIAEETQDYEPGHEQEAFYDNVRVAQNTLVLTKMAVNLKIASENSRTSMAMAEFYVEGNSPEVVVEIKAREVEFKDLFMRTMENFTGAELENAMGKQKLLDRLVKEANRLTTKGRVQKVYFKTIVLQI